MSSLDREFARLVAQLDSPMFIVTAAAGQQRSGCLVGFGSQVSIHPPRFVACLSVQNHTYRVALDTDTVVVHLVAPDREDLAQLFGSQTGDEVDKFSRSEWADGPGGAPVLAGLPNWFAARVLERVPFGDHVGFVLEPTEVHRGDPGGTLSFREVRWLQPGHEP
jgi:flavin reductase (DIM6/NTAB) family NADH-FMN oxidoreductase RutF